MNDIDAAIGRALRPSAARGGLADGEWAAIVRDAGATSRRGRRLLLLAAALLVAVLVAVPALGLADDILDIVQGDPAPPAVKEEVAQLKQVKGELIPLARRDPGILVERTFAARVLTTSGGRTVYLWITPRRDGGFCEHVQIVGMTMPDGRPNMGGGCSAGPLPRRLAATWGTTFVGDGYVSLLRGRVPPGVESMQARLDDGSLLPVRPSSSFFLEEVPPGREPVELVGLDAAGEPVQRQSFTRSLPGGRPGTTKQITGAARTVIAIVTSAGATAKVEVVPTVHGLCTNLRFRGTLSGSCGRRPERVIDVRTTQIGAALNGVLLLQGSVGGNVNSLTLRFEDGSSERLRIVDRLVLYEVHPEHFVEGKRPIELVARGANGRVVGMRKLGPWKSG